MSVVSLFFVSYLIACVKASNNQSQPHQYCIYSQKPPPNYYWRHYEGVIPHDAVPGGHTASGRITYIAQVLITGSKYNAILPGTMYIDQAVAVVPFYGVYKSRNYIAILCSDTPSALKWRLVNEHELPFVKDSLVVGGYEITQTIYIGRAPHSNHLIVGKVLIQDLVRLRIATPDNTEGYLTTFEVLVYDPTN